MKIEDQTVEEFLKEKRATEYNHFVFNDVLCRGTIKRYSDHDSLQILPLDFVSDIGNGQGNSVFMKFRVKQAITLPPPAQGHDEAFNVEGQFIAYLNHTGLHIPEMPEEQVRELRRAFFGGWGQLLLIFHRTVPNLPNDQVLAFFDNQIKQVQNFWDNENN